MKNCVHCNNKLEYYVGSDGYLFCYHCKNLVGITKKNGEVAFYELCKITERFK